MLALASLLLSGCAILRELGPAVEIEPMTPGEYIALKRGDILTSGKFSAATLRRSASRAWMAMAKPAPGPKPWPASRP